MALATANILSPNFKKGTKPKVESFMLKFRPKKSKQMTDEQMKRILRSVCGGGR